MLLLVPLVGLAFFFPISTGLPYLLESRRLLWDPSGPLPTLLLSLLVLVRP